MKSLQVGELKARFSEVLDEVQKGKSVGVLYGKGKKLIAEINPPHEQEKAVKRKIGIMDGKIKLVFADNFKMTDEELLDLRG